eukprot:GILJ01008704.1.p1 GENE.GILJ01008704.1~~GILJ01008704.1.p1  ORF type:complete len:550 (-),score=63.17 GILJ01008704.1:123-1772(-)
MEGDTGLKCAVDLFPSDVLVHIFSWLPIDVISNFSTLSKTTRDLTLQQEIWQHVDLSPVASRFSDSRIVQLLSRRCSDVAAPLVSVIEHLNLDNCKVNNETVAFIAGSNHRLRSLGLHGCNVSDAGYETIASSNSAKTLIRLDIRGCWGVRDDVIKLISAACPNIEDWRLSGVNLTDVGLYAIAKNCLNLKKLDISTCYDFTRRGVQAVLRSCSSLSVFLLRGCRQVSDDAFASEFSFDDGASLALEVAEGFGLDGEQQAGQRVAALPVELHNVHIVSGGLEVLDLSECRRLRNILQHVALNFPNLIELSVNRCGLVDDDGVCALATTCRGLRKLDLGHCSKLTDNAILAISNSSFAPLLEYLDLTVVELMTDKSAVCLATACPQLTTLYFGGCSQLTEVSVMAVANFCRKLEVISLTGCGVDDTSMLHFFPALSQLRVFILKSADRLSAAGVGAVKEAKKLRVLMLGNCPALDDKTMTAIARGCSNLQEITLFGCKLLKGRCFQKMAEEHSSLLPLLKSFKLRACNAEAAKALTDLASKRKGLSISVV